RGQDARGARGERLVDLGLSAHASRERGRNRHDENWLLDQHRTSEGPRGPVECILEDTGNAMVVFGRCDHDAIALIDRPPELPDDLRRLGTILTQVADLELCSGAELDLEAPEDGTGIGGLAQASRQAEKSHASDSLIHDSTCLVLAGVNERESTYRRPPRSGATGYPWSSY